MYEYPLQGDVAVITGAGAGIGRAISLGVGKAGARVVCADIDLGSAEAVAGEIIQAGGAAIALAVDVTKPDTCEALAAAIEAKFGPVSVLINNAAIALVAMADSAEFLGAFERSYAVNVGGVVSMTTALLDQLRRTHGRVVNVASTAAFLSSESAPYTVSKAAVAQLTKSLAMELGRDGIRVNAIAPGMTLGTKITSALKPDAEPVQRYLKRSPLGATATPQDMVHPVIFLASAHLSAHVTGVVMPVDGGFTITGMTRSF